jgi:DNA-binding transcriptional regulator YiaG
MAVPVEAILAKLPPERRSEIQQRAAELVAQELSLRDLRLAHQLTQEQLATSLSITQANVSRIEQRSDLLLSTLRSYIEAMGGHLHLVAEFPDRPPVHLAGFSDLK